ncbi:MAG: serine/threonine protein kinase [Gemmatales bacterium]|nr:MAG: serine/threonine protein kinase [Gemmatales bacterium]
MGFLDLFKEIFTSKPAKVDLEKRFELRGKSGQGSMSRVHPAIDRKTGRMVCVKILDKHKTAEFEKRFEGLNKPSEGEICTSLYHENVVRTFEYGVTLQGEPFLVMEWIDGVGLNYLIENRSKALKGRRVSYLRQMAEGLIYIHGKKFLHRDICPRNFMVTKDHVIKYIDFGLTIPYKPEFCRPGNRTGTADYLAPEVIKRVATDHRVDLFALGVSAYELVTGNLPWERARSQQTLLSHLNNPGRDPREFLPDLDNDTARFLIKAVERDPNRRFQTADQFREALDHLPPDL